MKKIILGAAVAALVLALGVTTVFAAGGRRAGFGNGLYTGLCTSQRVDCRFVDSNGDGICDNCVAGCWNGEAGAAGLCGRHMGGGRYGRG